MPGLWEVGSSASQTQAVRQKERQDTYDADARIASKMQERLWLALYYLTVSPSRT